MSSSQSIEVNSPEKQFLDLKKFPLWKHVSLVSKSKDGGGNRVWNCNYCLKENKGSYSRVKAHLLGISLMGIKSCTKVTKEIKTQLELEVEMAARKEAMLEDGRIRKSNYITLPSGSDLVQPKRRKGNPSSIENSFNLIQRDEIDKEIARMFYSAALPFNFARNPFWRSVCFKLSTYNVAGYRPPTYNRLRTTLLAQENTHIDKLIQPVKDVWVKRGVSICSDGWSDGSNKPIINIMAASGTTAAVFVNAVDASGIRKEASYIASIFIEAIKEVGFQNIVQIITDNGGNFKAAGMLFFCSLHFVTLLII